MTYLLRSYLQYIQYWCPCFITGAFDWALTMHTLIIILFRLGEYVLFLPWHVQSIKIIAAVCFMINQCGGIGHILLMVWLVHMTFDLQCREALCEDKWVNDRKTDLGYKYQAACINPIDPWGSLFLEILLDWFQRNSSEEIIWQKWSLGMHHAFGTDKSNDSGWWAWSYA